MMKSVRRLAGVLSAMAGIAAIAPGAPSDRPVFQVDYPFPTADKPQSKVWHAHGAWWALLPRANGPSLWQRTAAGWREREEVAAALRGVPGRADVWFDRDGATAVSVADRMLAVFRLSPGADAQAPWSTKILARIFAPASDSIETATIARDATGAWWVTAPVQGTVRVWSSPDARTWRAPVTLGRGLHVDDLCAVARLPQSIAVIWSNQKTDAVLARLHRDGDPPADWMPVETIAKGAGTADDHLRAAAAADGRLWVATKNSIDAIGEPQLVLRVREPGGTWRNFSYARLSDLEAPSRPIVLATPEPGAMLLGHVVYDEKEPARDRVVFGRADLGNTAILVGSRVVIAPAPALESRVNDVTGPKAAFPAAGPWIVLASDGAGRVYEADLRGVNAVR